MVDNVLLYIFQKTTEIYRGLYLSTSIKCTIVYVNTTGKYTCPKAYTF